VCERELRPNNNCTPKGSNGKSARRQYDIFNLVSRKSKQNAAAAERRAKRGAFLLLPNLVRHAALKKYLLPQRYGVGNLLFLELVRVFFRCVLVERGGEFVWCKKAPRAKVNSCKK
jgi:hypothetical protein